MLMQKLKTQCRRFFYRCKHEFFTFSNLLATAVMIALVLLVCGSITATAHNWELRDKLANRQLEEKRLEIEVEKLKLEQEFLGTEEFQELMAREKLGKMAEGETMLILPPNSEQAKAKRHEDKGVNIYEKNNFSRWMQFLFGLE